MTDHVKMFFKLNLIIMRILGFYPPQKFKHLYKLYACFVYVTFTFSVPALAGLHLMLDKNIDLAEVGDNSFIIFQAGCYIVKLIPFIFNVDQIRETIYMLEWPVFQDYTKEQESIIQECVKVCKRNTWLFLGFCMVTFTSWTASPLLGHGREFPIRIWLPFDPTLNIKTYIFVYVFVVLGVGNGAISNGVIDPLVSGMLCFAASQLKILKDNLENLGNYAEAKLVQNTRNPYRTKNKIIYDKIKTCIHHHNAILRFIQQYEQVYSPVAFAQFTAAVLVICVSCLQLSMVEPFTFRFFVMLSFLFTMLIEIFLYSYFGSSLFEETNNLTSAIYMGQWYEYDVKSRKALIVLMERSKKPVVVTAGKILELSLVTFTTILRRAYSLLAVLKNYDVDL